MVASHRLAIFDLDGTLIHYEFDHFFEGALDVLKKIGFGHVSRAELEDHFAHFDFFGFAPPDQRARVEKEFWNLHYRDSYPSPREIQGAIDALGVLAERDVTIAIATARSSVPDELTRELRGTGLLPYVHFIATKHGHDSVWWDKRDQLTAVCREFGVAHPDAFMVGDTPPDIWSAKEIGLGKTVGVLSGGIHEHVLRNADPDHLLLSIGEMVSLIETGRCRK